MRKTKHFKIIAACFIILLTLLNVSCENNLLEILGRDVFFATVVDPFSIAIDFEYVGEYPVNQNSPIYLGLLPVPLTGYLDSVLPVAKITSRLRQNILISKDTLDTIISVNNEYLLVYLHDIDGNFSDSTPATNFIDNQADANPENFPRNGTPDFVGIYSTVSGGKIVFRFEDFLDETFNILQTSRITPGNRYVLKASEIIIEADNLEYDDDLTLAVNNFPIPTIPSAGSITVNRTLHRDLVSKQPGDADHIVFRPSINGNHVIQLTLDSLSTGGLDNIQGEYQLVYRPLIVQFKLGEVSGSIGSETIENYPLVHSGSLTNLTPNDTSNRYFMVDGDYDSGGGGSLAIRLRELNSSFERIGNVQNDNSISFTVNLDNNKDYAIAIYARGVNPNSDNQYTLTGRYSVSITGP
jgi:hypothetical protein